MKLEFGLLPAHRHQLHFLPAEHRRSPGDKINQLCQHNKLKTINNVIFMIVPISVSARRRFTRWWPLSSLLSWCGTQPQVTRIIYIEKEGYNVHICAMLVVVILSGTYGGQTKDLTIELFDGEISLARFNMKNNTVWFEAFHGISHWCLWLWLIRQMYTSFSKFWSRFLNLLLSFKCHVNKFCLLMHLSP